MKTVVITGKRIQGKMAVEICLKRGPFSVCFSCDRWPRVDQLEEAFICWQENLVVPGREFEPILLEKGTKLYPTKFKYDRESAT